MIKQKFFLDFSSKTLHHIFQAIGGIVVARYAGPTIVGTIAYGAAFVGIFNFINGLLGPAHVKIISETNNEGACNTTFSILKILFITIFIFFSISAYLISKYYFNTIFTTDKEWIIFISILVIVLQNIILIPQGIFIAKMQQARLNIPYLIQGILYNSIRSIIAILGFGAVILSSIPIFVSIILIPFYIYLLKDIPFSNFNWNIAKRYFIISQPIFIIVICNTASINVSRLILEYYTSTLVLGLFIAGNNIAGILGLISGTAGSLFYPLFSKSVAEKNNNKIQKYIKNYATLVFMWIYPIVIFLCLFSDNIILSILGQDYLVSSEVFKIIIFSSFLQMLAIPFGNLLFSYNKFNLAAFISILKFVLQITIVSICVHPSMLNYGVISLAIAILFTELFIFFIRYYYSNKIINLSLVKDNILYFLYGLSIYFLYILFLIPYSNKYFINQFSIMITYFFVHYSIMILLGMINKNDFTLLKNIVSYKKMKMYIQNELTSNK